MKHFTVRQIGQIEIGEEGMFVRVEPEFRKALQALEGFSHINIFWWFDGCDNNQSRNILEVYSPYKQAPAVMGTFATRSPERPNPIALTVAQLINIDHEAGLIQISYTDANHGSPVLDIKPYTPSLDRVENPEVPGWCSQWPVSLEKSGDFDWESVFNF